MSKSGLLPSYEESISNDISAQEFSGEVSKGQKILDQLTVVRAQHICSVIEEHVYPLVVHQATYGIAKTTVALIPSDVTIPQVETTKSEFGFESNEIRKIELVGFSSGEDVQQVQLEGPMNRIEFWGQQGIVRELERVLQEKLITSPQLQASNPQLKKPERLPLKPSKRGFFSRIGNSSNLQPIQSPDEPTIVPEENAAQFQVQAKVDEMCLRTVSQFGLYETTTRHGILIRVNLRY